MADLVDEMFGDVPTQQSQQAPQLGQGSSGDLVADLFGGDELEAQTPQLDNSTPKTQGVQGAGTPDNPFQGIVEFSQKVMQAHELGQANFRDAALGHAVMTGDMTFEEAEKQIAADDHFAMLSNDIEQYEKDSQLPWLTGIAMATAKQLPMIEESLKRAVPVGLGAGGVTAATGVGSAVAVPVGVFAGTAAAAGWSSDVIVGQEYMERRRKGFSHEEAEKASRISAVIQGSLSGLQFGSIAKLPVNTAKNILAAHAATLGHFFKEAGLFAAEQMVTAEASTAAKLATDAIAATVSNKPNLVPTVEEATKEFVNTFNETLKAGTGTFIGGKLIGTAGGYTLKSIAKKAHDKHIANQQAKLEKIEQARLEVTGEVTDGGLKATAEALDEPNESKAAANRKRIAKEKAEKRQAAINEVHRIIAAAHSLFRIESDETRLQQTNRIQRVLKRMVSNSDKLDDKMKVTLLKRVIEIDGEAALLKQGEKFVNDLTQRELDNDHAAAVTRLEGVIKKGQPKKGKKTAGLTPEAAQEMKWYKEFFDEPKLEKGAYEKGGPTKAEITRERARQRAADYVQSGFDAEVKATEKALQKLEDNELVDIFNQPAELAEKRRVAILAEQYYSGKLDTDGINKLADDIEAAQTGAKSEFKARKEAEAKRLLDNRAKVHDGVQGEKPVTPSQANTAPKEMTGIGRVVNSLRRNSSALWDKLLQDTKFDDRQPVISKILDFTESENRESGLKIRNAEKLIDLYTSAVGGKMREVNKLIRNGMKNEKFDVQYTDSSGNTQTLGRASLNELAYLHIAFEDPGAVPGLVHGNGFTLDGMVEPGQTSTQSVVRQILQEREGGKYIKLAEAVRDFYTWFAPDVANHYLKEYGTPLPMNENYSGQIFHRQVERQKSAADLLNSVHGFAAQSLDPGSTKARSNSKLPLKLYDPFQQVQRHASEMSFWIANSEKARELSFIFSDTSKDGLRDVIAHKLGAEFNNMIDARLAFQYHLKPGIMDIADRAYSSLKGNMSTGLLGARIDQAPKSWTSILATLSTSNYGEFLDGLRGAADPNRLKEYVSRSAVYAERQDKITQQIADATKQRSFADAITGDSALGIKDFFMVPMREWGDGVASAVAGFVEYNRVLKAGGSIEEAVTAGDKMVDTTQSSSRPGQKVPGEYKGGIANLSLSFAKEGIQSLNRESGAIRDYFIHKDDASLKRMARVIVATHAAQALFQTINSMPGILFGDEDEQKEAALRIASGAIGGSYGSLPLLGFDVVHGAISGFKGQQEPRTIIGGLTADSAKLVKRLYTITKKLAEDEEVEGEEWVRAFGSAAGVASMATGIPFWGMYKYTTLGSKAWTKVTEGE